MRKLVTAGLSGCQVNRSSQGRDAAVIQVSVELEWSSHATHECVPQDLLIRKAHEAPLGTPSSARPFARVPRARAPRATATTLPASSVRAITTPRIGRRCGISSRNPFLRYAYFPPWPDVACPTRRFTSSLALSRSHFARRTAIRIPPLRTFLCP